MGAKWPLPFRSKGVRFLAAGMCLLLVFAWPAQPSRAEGPPIDGVAGGRLERILQRQRLIVGVKSDYPPWGMVAADGSIVGLEPDLAKNVAERLGVALELVSVTTGNRLRRLEDGAVDMVIATLGDTFERQQISALVRPHYYASGVNLLAPAGSPFEDWGQLRGRPVCLTDGAYYNRTLSERYLVEPVVFRGTRDTLLALRDGRCVGWAFDDTALVRLLSDPRWSDYRLAMPTILRTPWAIAVQKSEGDMAWGRFVADMVADWHRSGRLVDLQAKWGLPPNNFLVEQHALWSAAGEGGPVCARDEAGLFPPDCLRDEVARTAGACIEIPGWGRRLQELSGLDLGPLFDAFDRGRLVRGIRLTLDISLVSIAGSLGIAVIFAWIDATAGPGAMARLSRLPLRCLVALARMTPPILQLYILFFGLGGLLASGHELTLASFLVASAVFSLYAGATNTVLLRSSLARLRQERPEASTLNLIPAAVERSYEGLVSTSVNIVKAAGLASTIAVPETISAVNTIISEGGDAGTMMNLLLVFYFLFVLTVLGLLWVARGLVMRWT